MVLFFRNLPILPLHPLQRIRTEVATRVPRLLAAGLIPVRVDLYHLPVAAHPDSRRQLALLLLPPSTAVLPPTAGGG